MVKEPYNIYEKIFFRSFFLAIINLGKVLRETKPEKWHWYCWYLHTQIFHSSLKSYKTTSYNLIILINLARLLKIETNFRKPLWDTKTSRHPHSSKALKEWKPLFLRYSNADLKIWQHFRLDIKNMYLRCHIITPFTFWDMQAPDM